MQKKEDGISSKKNSSIFSLVLSYKVLIALLIFFTISASLVSLIAPKIIAHGIDSYTNGNFKPQQLLLEFAGVAFFVLIFTYLQNIVQTYASEKVGHDLRKDLAHTISLQSYTFVQQITPATLLTNLSSDVDAVKVFVSQAIGMIIASVCLIIGTSVLLIMTNWELGLAVLTMVPIIAGAFFTIMGRIRKLFLQTQAIIDWLNKVINESILGAGLIRVLNAEQYEGKKFLKANTDARNIGLEILRYFAILIPIITFVTSSATILIISLGGHFVIIDKMTLGDLTAFNSYVGILVFPIIMIGFMTGLISRSSASYDRIKTVLYNKPSNPSGNIPADLQGNIEVSHISLKLGGKDILKDISFTIKPKSKTAIIGPTAAGKTQLLYILHGLIQPDQGEILYDETPLSHLNTDTFYQQIGFVFQDSIIFNTSIYENIAFAETIQENDVKKAITSAELTDLISSLPKKLDTVVSERGASLSGGQKQRIMLARALSLNPRILLLDDFTARVDTITEKEIIKNIGKNYPDLTLISVTQKISSIVNYDQIILLMEGEIIASGTHTELMETSPEYVQLYNSQHSTNYYELHT
ncbi:MAG TPA: ABC transporter ATP-binding protein [Candidatus Woesebacteria bacterium]|nr:ABC transporter ATP-binding protein [Candidatus Woesebacteria bacterium]